MVFRDDEGGKWRQECKRIPRLLACAVISFVLIAPFSLAATLWYEHYQQGLDLESQGQWSHALESFSAAAKLASTPKKRINTYGQNYIFDYDPHYHRAMCLTELGRFNEAMEALETSYRYAIVQIAVLKTVENRITDGMAKSQTTATAHTPVTSQANQDPPVKIETGILNITSNISGATVLLDGKPLGSTPLESETLPYGEYRVRLEAEGYVSQERRVIISSVTPRNERFDLDAIHVQTVVHPALTPAATPTPPRQPKSTPTQAAPVPTTPNPSVTPYTPTPLPTIAPFVQTPLASASKPKSIIWWIVLLTVSALAAAIVGVFIGRRRKGSEDVKTAALQRLTLELETGQRFGNFELKSVLGRGGMGTTYHAKRVTDGKSVALKIPHDRCLADDSFTARFVREGQLGEQLHHPRIVRIFEAGEASNRPYLAMEIISGHTLKQEVRNRGPLPIERAIEIISDIAEALDYAHAKGVIHRDLKPENVMILDDESIKVMDFGLAHVASQPALTSSSLFIGTPLYAAPEMIDPKHVDNRADLYSLGIVFFEMLQGQVPFSADSPFMVVEMHRTTPLPEHKALVRPVPENIWRMVARLCEKRPDDRYSSAESLLVDLRRQQHAADDTPFDV